MKNLKIKFKLYGLSGVLILSTFFVSALSLVLMAEVNQGTTVVSANWLPSVIIAEELNTATSDFRIAEASHVISQDAATMLKHEATLEQVSQEIDQMFLAYSSRLVTNEVDGALLEEAQRLWQDYLEVHATMIAFSQDNNTQEAMYSMEHQSEEIFDQVSLVFLELVQFNKSGADQASLDGDSTYKSATVIISTIMLLTTVAGYFWSQFIIAGVVKPVSEIETAALELLKGKFSTEIHYTSQDELGSLSSSMRTLCQMIQDMIADLRHLLGAIAEGDFSVKTEQPDLYVGEFAPLLLSTQNISTKLSDAQFELQHRDALTGFYNRAGYSHNVTQMMEVPPKKMGVISININGLKQINENSGVTAGDQHIKLSANRLSAHFGYEFFRMSGDEFVGIAPDVEKDPFEEKTVELYTAMKKEQNYAFSVGHAWGTGNYDLSKLLQEAETVMYINKQEYYANSARQSDQVDDTLLKDLLSYLENDEFMIYLQPQVHLKDGSLYGAEALIRRFDKTNQKMVFPDQFISLYEQKSIIRHVDIFVVEAVCQRLSQWNKVGKAVPISVNLSRVTLLEYGIVDTIVTICDKYQVPHSLLVIEVTERVGLIENNVASALITNFKTQGFHISLDDFGCAYSNIITLAQIEVDEVKIDKSLVDDVTTNPKNHILVKNVLSMCNELEGTSTLAEGIEDETQATLLHQLGCHLGQGYFYSRPIPVDAFEADFMGATS